MFGPLALIVSSLLLLWPLAGSGLLPFGRVVAPLALFGPLALVVSIDRRLLTIGPLALAVSIDCLLLTISILFVTGNLL